MSIINELENWDPMAEDYSCPKFNSYNNSFTQYDDCSLYLKNIPASLSQDAFIALMSENGRRVVRSKLYPARQGMDKTAGLVSFESSKDAQEVINLLNNQPPLNLIINFAKKKESSNKQEILHDRNSSIPYSQKNFHSSESVGLIPRPLISKVRESSSSAPTFPSLKVVLDGKKRVAYHAPKLTEVKEKLPLDTLDIPTLIDNPFLSCLCGSIGKFSCEICKKPYCSKNCQVEDWPNHKSSCKPFTKSLRTNENNPLHKTSHDSSYVSDSSSSDTDKKLPTPSPSHTNNLISKKSLSEIANNFVTDSHFIKVDDIKSSILPPDKQSQVKICHIQSPSLFWVHLKNSETIISQMEKETYLPTVKPPTSYEINNLYSFIEDGIFKRVNVLKNNEDGTISVRLMDYGKIAVVQSKNLFALPDKLKQIPYQAICCKLVDTFEDKEIVWNEDDTISFQMYATNAYYTARVIRCINKIYHVNLTNDEGISLYSIIAGLKTLNLSSVEIKDDKIYKSCEDLDKIKAEHINNKNSLKPSISSVWENLKSGTEVKILGVEFDEDKFWGILDDGSGVSDKMTQLTSLFQNLKTKEVNLYCEEGDIVAGYSTDYGEFYRCVVLKRMRDNFLVHFIDFGNKEKVTKLCELTPDLLNICCYGICCEKPNFLSAEEFKKIFQVEKTASVKKTDNIVELSFIHNNATISVTCFPWYHVLPLNYVSKQIETKNVPSQILKKVQSINDVVNSDKKIPNELSIASDKKLSNELSITSEKKITSDLIGNQNIISGNKYKVKVVFIIDVSKIYVQLCSLEKDLDLISEQLNKYCTSSKTIDYTPVKNEIVCCKFAADGNWYRGQVIGKRGKCYRVFFIDFGNEDMVCSENLLPLPEKFAVDKFSICVSLSNLKNEDLSKSLILKLTNETWDMEVMNSLTSLPEVILFQDNKSLLDFVTKKRLHTKSSLTFKKLPPGKSEVMVCHNEQEIVYVHLVSDKEAISDMHDKVNSADKVPLDKKAEVNNIYRGLFNDGLWYRVLVKKEVDFNSYKVKFLDYGNDSDVSLKDLCELKSELLDFPVFGIPVIPQNLKISQMVQQIPYLVEVVGETPDSQLIKVLNVPGKELPRRECLKKSVFTNGMNEILLCHIEEEVFFCQLTADIKLSATMITELQSASKKRPMAGELSVGCLVCVKSSDEHWYRGVVETIFDDQSYDISFIDFGNSEKIPADDVMLLSEEFFKYPIFCIPFKISNYKDAQKYAVINNVLLIRVGDSSTKVPLVELIVPKNQNLPNIVSLEKRLLPLDKVQDIEICHKEGDIFYVHMTSDKEQIKSLESKLQCAEEFETVVDLLEVGAVVCAKFTDDTWYRGSVEKTCDKTNICSVCFIDYGNVAEIQICDVKILPSELNSLPIFSILVKFKNLDTLYAQLQKGNISISVRTLNLSEDGIHLVEVVTQYNAITSINYQLLSDLPVQITVCYEENGIYFVQKVSDSEKVQEMMLHLQQQECLKAITHIPKDGEFLCVKHEDGLWYRGLIKKNWGDICKVYFIDYGNTSDVNIKNMFYLPSAAAALPMFCIPIKLSDSNKITTQLSVDEQYIVKQICSLSDNVQLVKVCPPFVPICLSSMKISVLNDNSTSVHFQSFDGKFYYATKANDHDKIVEMNVLLNNFEGENIIQSPVIDEILVVKSADGKFYRGCVVQLSSHKFKVFLIDIGRTEDVATSEMYYMPSQLSLYPVFSIKVVLNSSLKKSITFGEKYIISKIDDAPTLEIYPQYTLSLLKRQYLPLGEPKNVMLVHMEHDVFFFQDLLDSSRILELESLIQSYCSSSKCVSHQLTVGDLLVGQSSIDSAWHRGCVQEKISDNNYKIKFVDYGNTEIISIDKLHCFKEEFLDYPVFCMGVKMTNVSSKLQLEEVYTVVAESQPVNDDPQIVSFVPKPELQQPSSNLIEANVGNKEECIKYFYSKWSHVPFPPGQQDVIIYTVITSDLAFCAPYNEQNINAGVELTASLTEYCNNLNVSSYNGNEPPKIDEMVLAKFEGEWYRAVVVDNQSAPFYDLLYVDYGNTEKVHLDFLRQMTGQFMALDIQAHPCRLTGFQFEEKNSSAIVEELKQFTYTSLKGSVSVINNEVHLCVNQIVDHLTKKNIISA